MLREFHSSEFWISFIILLPNSNVPSSCFTDLSIAPASNKFCVHYCLLYHFPPSSCLCFSCFYLFMPFTYLWLIFISVYVLFLSLYALIISVYAFCIILSSVYACFLSVYSMFCLVMPFFLLVSQVIVILSQYTCFF